MKPYYTLIPNSTNFLFLYLLKSSPVNSEAAINIKNNNVKVKINN